jgi:hypothetical protein
MYPLSFAHFPTVYKFRCNQCNQCDHVDIYRVFRLHRWLHRQVTNVTHRPRVTPPLGVTKPQGELTHNHSRRVRPRVTSVPLQVTSVPLQVTSVPNEKRTPEGVLSVKQSAFSTGIQTRNTPPGWHCSPCPSASLFLRRGKTSAAPTSPEHARPRLCLRARSAPHRNTP